MVLDDVQQKLLGYVPTVLICALCFSAVFYIAGIQINTSTTNTGKPVDARDLYDIMVEIDAEQYDDIYTSISVSDESVEKYINEMPTTLYFIETDAGNVLSNESFDIGTSKTLYGEVRNILGCREATYEDKKSYATYMLEYNGYWEELRNRAEKVYAEKVYK